MPKVAKDGVVLLCRLLVMSASDRQVSTQWYKYLAGAEPCCHTATRGTPETRKRGNSKSPSRNRDQCCYKTEQKIIASVELPPSPIVPPWKMVMLCEAHSVVVTVTGQA